MRDTSAIQTVDAHVSDPSAYGKVETLARQYYIPKGFQLKCTRCFDLISLEGELIDGVVRPTPQIGIEIVGNGFKHAGVPHARTIVEETVDEFGRMITVRTRGMWKGCGGTMQLLRLSSFARITPLVPVYKELYRGEPGRRNSSRA